MLKNIRAKISLFSLSGLGLYFLPLIARAEEGGILDTLSALSEFVNSPMKVVFFIMTLVTYVVGYLGGILLTLMAGLTDFMLDLNTKILPDTIGTITRGFETTLSIANLAFVVALIIIAFATILQIESFSMKQLLGKLIIAAILINFSLLIAGLFLDVSHVLTNFFLSGGNVEQSGGIFSLGGSIANSLNPAEFLIEPTFDQITGELDKSITVLISAQFMSIFTWVLAVAMGAVAVMFVVRYVALTFLLILMPLAWVSPLIPVKYFRDVSPRWWDAFLQQVFFLPIVAFFLVIATQSASGLTNAINTLSSGLGNYDAALGTTGLSPNLLQILVQLVVVIGLVVGGLKAAAETGGMAGKIGNSFAQKAKKGLLGGAKGLGRLGLQKSGLESTARKEGGKLAAQVARIPLMQGVANRLAGVADPEKAIQARGKSNYSNLAKTEEGRKAIIASGPSALDMEDRAATLEAFVKEKALGDFAVKDGNGKLNASATMRGLTPYVEAMKKLNPDTPPEKIKELQGLAAKFPKLAAGITGQSARQAIANANMEDMDEDTMRENIEFFSDRQKLAYIKKSDSNEVAMNSALVEELKGIDGAKLKEGGDTSTISRLDDINKRLKKQIDIEKNPKANPDKKDAAGKEVQKLLIERADIIDKIDVDKISLEERGIVNSLKKIAYSIGSSTASAKKPKAKGGDSGGTDRFEKPTTPEARAAAENLLKNI